MKRGYEGGISRSYGLPKKVIVPQTGVTGMDSEIAITFVVVSTTVGGAVAAVEAVAVALAVNCNNGAVLRGNTTAGLISDGRGKETFPQSYHIQATVPLI